MDDKKFKEMADFETEATKNVTGPTAISPSLIQQLAGLHGNVEDLIGTKKLPGEGYDFVTPKKQQFFYVVWQNAEGRIIDIKHYDDYDVALMRGMDQAKDTGTSWSIFALNGRFVDGNVNRK